MELTDRQKSILFAIIEQYAEVAAPVGSVTLAKLFGVSSATIRTEMARLEDFGLIAQPHTSAGRVPTDAGYRYYVNELSATAPDFNATGNTAPSPAQNTSESSPEAPRGAGSQIRSIIPQDRNIHALRVRIDSQTRADHAIRSAVDALVELTGNLGLATIGGQLYLSGIARLFAQPEFMDTDRIHAVAELLDNLEPWLSEARPGEPLNIFIGTENPIGKNSGASLIISKFRSPYSDSSYIGVLGPTRQNYASVISLVRSAGFILEQSL